MADRRASVIAADPATAAWLADLDAHDSGIEKQDTFWPDRVARATVLGSSRARHVLLELVSFVSWESGKCWPCVMTIARRSALSESTVRRAIRELCDAGVIAKETRFDAVTGRQQSNRYVLHRSNRWTIQRGLVSVTRGGVSR